MTQSILLHTQTPLATHGGGLGFAQGFRQLARDLGGFLVGPQAEKGFGFTQVVMPTSGTFCGTGFVSVTSGSIIACSEHKASESKPVPALPT